MTIETSLQGVNSQFNQINKIAKQMVRDSQALQPETIVKKDQFVPEEAHFNEFSTVNNNSIMDLRDPTTSLAKNFVDLIEAQRALEFNLKAVKMQADNEKNLTID